MQDFCQSMQSQSCNSNVSNETSPVLSMEPPSILPTRPSDVMLWRLKASCSMIRNGCDVLLGTANTPSTDEVWLSGGEVLFSPVSSSSVCILCRSSWNRRRPLFPVIFFSTSCKNKCGSSEVKHTKTKQYHQILALMQQPWITTRDWHNQPQCQ